MSDDAALSHLSGTQRRLLATWLPGFEVVADMSWELVSTRVLHLRHDGRDYVAKASGPEDHHLAREIHAHLHWLNPWKTAGRVVELVQYDETAHLILTSYLPGTLVEGSPAQDDPKIFHQAGTLLASLHGQETFSAVDADYEKRRNTRTFEWLDATHRIAPGIEARLREIVQKWPTEPARLVVTHDDWQPRNWLAHEELVYPIDFGKVILHPAHEDFTRLDAQDFRRDPRLEAAFIEGYGSDPRQCAAYCRQQLRSAISTAVWAFSVGAHDFEAQGHRMIAEWLQTNT